MKPAEQRDRLLVDQILHHTEILSEIVRRGRSAMSTDPTNRYAAEHAIELLAEAAEKLSQTFKTANPKIPWEQLRPLRRTVAHPYDLGAEPINVAQLWGFAGKDAPRIARLLRKPKFPGYEGKR